MGRLEKLKGLEALLAMELQNADTKSMAALARQYRETIKEIDELEGGNAEEDEISKILAE